MEYILVAGAIYLAFKLGVVWHRHYFAWIIANHPDQLDRLIQLAKKGELDPNMLTSLPEDDVPAEIRENGTELEIERVNNVLYAYAMETGQFIAQGVDLKSVLESAHKRFPGKIFFGNIPEDNPAKELV